MHSTHGVSSLLLNCRLNLWSCDFSPANFVYSNGSIPNIKLPTNICWFSDNYRNHPQGFCKLQIALSRLVNYKKYAISRYKLLPCRGVAAKKLDGIYLNDADTGKLCTAHKENKNGREVEVGLCEKQSNINQWFFLLPSSSHNPCYKHVSMQSIAAICK